MRIEPLGEKVVVKRLEATEKTSGGILIPDSAREKPLQGKVLAVGTGRVTPTGVRQKMQVAEGDRILFSHYAGTEISLDGMDVLILDESEILAVID